MTAESPPSFYILHGDDSFSIAEEVQAMKQKLGDPAMAELNITEFDGRSVTLSDLRSVAGTLPFLTHRRLVIVNGFLSRLQGKASEGGDENDEGATPAAGGLKQMREALAAYLPEVPATTGLVFVEPKALHERNRFLSLAERGGGYVRRYDPPAGDELTRWIMRRAKAAGGEFNREGAQALASAAGDDLRLLDNEIEKLLAYVGWTRPVDQTDVEMLTPYAGEVKVFDMVDAMGQGQARVAVNQLHRLLEQPSQTPLAVFGMVARQFRLLLTARELLAEGAPPAEVARSLHLPPFVAGKLAEQSRRFSPADLEAIFHKLLEMDLAIKSSRIDGALALDTFVADPLGWQIEAQPA